MTEYKSPYEVLDAAAAYGDVYASAKFLEQFESKIVRITTRMQRGLIVAHPTWRDTSIKLSKHARYQIFILVNKLNRDQSYDPYEAAVNYPFYEIWLDGEMLPKIYE